MLRRYPSIQQVLMANQANHPTSPRSRALANVLESLDETAYHLYSSNEERAKTRVIETAASVLGLANVVPSDRYDRALATDTAVPEMPTQVCNKIVPVEVGDYDDNNSNKDGGGGDDERVSKRWHGLHVIQVHPHMLSNPARAHSCYVLFYLTAPCDTSQHAI